MNRIVQLRSAKIPKLGLVADHYWFVTYQKGKKDRWEIWQNTDSGGQSWQHLHKNRTECESGVGNGNSTIEHQWFSDDADKLIRQIENSPTEYDNRNRYRYWPGPNSNTFVQWVLDRTELDLMLGPTAIGKDYLGVVGFRKVGSIIQVSTPFFGFKLNWPVRFELHLLTLTFGICIKPFQFIHPFYRTF